MSYAADSAALLRHVPADGSTIGDTKLRQTLGWDEERYVDVRDALVWRRTLATGHKGRGDGVRLASASEADDPAPIEEMFDPKLVSKPAPVKRVAAPAAKAPKSVTSPVTTYQFADATRKDIPPAGLASKSTVHETAPHRLSYDPHLSPVLRYDSTGETDQLTVRIQDILEKAKTETLTPEETQLLSDALLAGTFQEGDTILVCKRDRAEEIKQVVGEIARRKLDQYL